MCMAIQGFGRIGRRRLASFEPTYTLTVSACASPVIEVKQTCCPTSPPIRVSNHLIAWVAADICRNWVTGQASFVFWGQVLLHTKSIVVSLAGKVRSRRKMGDPGGIEGTQGICKPPPALSHSHAIRFQKLTNMAASGYTRRVIRASGAA